MMNNFYVGSKTFIDILEKRTSKSRVKSPQNLEKKVGVIF